MLFQEPEPKPEPEKKVPEKPKLKPKPPAAPPAPPKEDVKEKMFQLKGIKCRLQSFINLLQTSIQSSKMGLLRIVLLLKVCTSDVTKLWDLQRDLRFMLPRMPCRGLPATSDVRKCLVSCFLGIWMQRLSR